MTRKTGFYNIANLHILAIILILLTSQSFTALSFATADNSVLMELITQNEDPRMGVKDLAFFLATHDFDAVPKKTTSKSISMVASTSWCPMVNYPGWPM
jgi:hypothetical protein